MPYVEQDVPSAGDPTRQIDIETVIGNIAFLFSTLSTAGATAGANGSFENDSDGDNYPDEWTYSSGTNGVGTIITTDSAHGKQSFKFTRSTGVGNSGGTLESADFFEVAASYQLFLQWAMKVTVAGVRVKVAVRYFDRSQTFISEDTIYNSIANPTSWSYMSANSDPPSTAYYAKVRIYGGDTSPDVANCDIFFDDFIVSRAAKNMLVFTSSGTWNCKVPRARIRIWGAGGGGGGGSGGSAGGSGGGGQYREAWVDSVPGTAYTVTCPAGGAGGTASPGVSGGSPADASVGSLLSAGSGDGGIRGESGGAGGAAGTGGAGGLNPFSINGEAGQASAGNGGFCALGGRGGLMAGQAGMNPGGGGRGGAAGQNGADGGDARVVIDW